jgi:hypothetical protein
MEKTVNRIEILIAIEFLTNFFFSVLSTILRNHDPKTYSKVSVQGSYKSSKLFTISYTKSLYHIFYDD